MNLKRTNGMDGNMQNMSRLQYRLKHEFCDLQNEIILYIHITHIEYYNRKCVQRANSFSNFTFQLKCFKALNIKQ